MCENADEKRLEYKIKGEIRRLMLKALYELGSGLHSSGEITEQMIMLGDISPKQIDEFLYDAIEYLSDKGLAEYNPIPAANALKGIGFFTARITAYGKDIVEGGEAKLDKEIPIATKIEQTVNISGGNIGGITNTGNVNINQLLQNKPIEFGELKKLIKNTPSLLEWFKNIAQVIPDIKQIFDFLI